MSLLRLGVMGAWKGARRASQPQPASVRACGCVPTDSMHALGCDCDALGGCRTQPAPPHLGGREPDSAVTATTPPTPAAKVAATETPPTEAIKILKSRCEKCGGEQQEGFPCVPCWNSEVMEAVEKRYKDTGGKEDDMIKVEECFCESIMTLAAVDEKCKLYWCARCGRLGCEVNGKMRFNVPSVSVMREGKIEGVE